MKLPRFTHSQSMAAPCPILVWRAGPCGACLPRQPTISLATWLIQHVGRQKCWLYSLSLATGGPLWLMGVRIPPGPLNFFRFILNNFAEGLLGWFRLCLYWAN